MPGLCGIFRCNDQPALAADLERMSAALRHFDWYSTERYLSPDGGFLIAQTVISVNNRVAFGPAHLTWLHGDENDAFTRVRFDTTTKTLTIENDPFGMMPVVYAQCDGLFLFATELKAVLAHPAVERSIDPCGLADLALFGFILGEKTLVRGVRCLPGGTRLNVSAADGRCTLERTWDIRSHIGNHRRDERELLESLNQRFCRSVERACSASPVGVSLSGGLDSRTIMSAVDHRNVVVKSLTLDVPGGADQVISQRVAHCTNGLENHTFVENSADFFARWSDYVREMVWLSDGMFYDEACVMMPTLDQYRRLGVQAVLRGHGGELARMHEAYELRCNRHIRACRTRGQLVDQLYRQMNFALREEDLPRFFLPELARDMRGAARASLEEAIDGIDPKWHVVDQVTCLYAQEYLRRQCVPSMALLRSRVNVRMPFLDRSYVEGVLQLSPATRLTTRVHRHILRRNNPRLLKIVNANTGIWAGLPDRAHWFSRKLHSWLDSRLGYTPYRHYVDVPGWLQGPLRSHLERLTDSTSPRETSALFVDEVSRMVSSQNRSNQNPAGVLTLFYLDHWRRDCLQSFQTALSG
jgi:asparagine synthase (glutamine-hydrolysing)